MVACLSIESKDPLFVGFKMGSISEYMENGRRWQLGRLVFGRHAYTLRIEEKNQSPLTFDGLV